MKIIRSVNGVEISEEDFKKLDLTNPTLEKIFAEVVKQIKMKQIEEDVKEF